MSVKGMNAMEKNSAREALEAHAQRTISEIRDRLSEAVNPTLLQILWENKRERKPAITTLLGVTAFAASEVAVGIQVMARCGADQNKLVEFCSKTFKQWVLDCIEQNIAGPPN